VSLPAPGFDHVIAAKTEEPLVSAWPWVSDYGDRAGERIVTREARPRGRTSKARRPRTSPGFSTIVTMELCLTLWIRSASLVPKTRSSWGLVRITIIVLFLRYCLGQ